MHATVESALVGHSWTDQTVGRFPKDIDPCGENGEFHTCLVGGLGLETLPYELGEIVERDGSCYCDLLIQEE